jgi:hypothetical protein
MVLTVHLVVKAPCEPVGKDGRYDVTACTDLELGKTHVFLLRLLVDRHSVVVHLYGAWEWSVEWVWASVGAL